MRPTVEHGPPATTACSLTAFAHIAGMETPEVMIPVRNEKQAMDWSLVLVSQGIETAIQQSPENGRPVLVVSPWERERALAAIRQYERENQYRRWQQPIRWTGLLLDWRVVLALFPLVLAFFFSDVMGVSSLKTRGIMDSTLVSQGEWWRLFTAVTLHADAAHLASNFVMGTLLIGLAMGSYGPGRALLASFCAGAGGNLGAWLLLAERHRSLGASGMVMGALGLLTVQSFSLFRQGANHRALVGRAVAAGVLLLVLVGLNPHTDVMGHVGGFVAGCVLGPVLIFLPERLSQAALFDRIAGIAVAALAGLAWWCALR